MTTIVHFARRSTALAALVLGLFVGAAAAEPVRTFPAGTFIIPWQSAGYLGSGYSALIVHGFMHRLLQRDGVLAYRGIDPEKVNADSNDFVVSAATGDVVEDYQGTAAPGGSRVSYLGGPWIIPPEYQADLDAVLADPAWSAVQIHRVLVPFTAPVTAVHQLSSRPIGMLVSNDEVEAARARPFMESFLQLGGLAGGLATVTPDQIVAGALTGANAPAVLLAPYARPLSELIPSELTTVLGEIRTWLRSGNTLIAQDDAVAFLENQASGRFLTTGGLGINGVIYGDGNQNLLPGSAKESVLSANDFVAQIGGSGAYGDYCAGGWRCVPGSGGLVVTFRPYQSGDATLTGAGAPTGGSAYQPTVRRLYSWDADGTGYSWDIAVVGHADGVSTSGTVAYLAGHVIPAEGEQSPQIDQSVRQIFMNAFFSVRAAPPRVTHAGVTVDRDLIQFKGSISVADGRGHLEAFDAATDLTTRLWDAAEHIPADASRRIYTHDGTALADVTSANAFVTSLLSRQEIERLRGRTLDPTGVYQNLANRLGAIDRSTAVAVGPSSLVEGAEARGRTVYVGTLDGLLEAVDASSENAEPAGTGTEMWALVPRCQVDRLAADGIDADLGVDGSPTVADLWIDHAGTPAFRTVLTVPMGASSPHILALDVSDRQNPQVLWEITDQGTVDMGFATKTAMGHIAEPDGAGNLVRTAVVWVATSKYRQTDGGGLSLYCFRAQDGVKLWEFHQTYASGVNDIPPPVVAVDPDGDGFIETVFAGDNEGRVWAVNARTGKSLYCNDDPSYCNNPSPVYPANDGSDPSRPIGAAPAVVAEGGQMIVLFGTGGYDWAPAETVQQKFVGLLVPTQGAPSVLFNIALEPGDRVYASPVVDRHAHYLFLGKTHGRVGGGTVLPDADATATVETYDISAALGGNAGVPSKSGDDVVLTQALPGSLQLQGGVLFGATADSESFLIGDVGAATAAPRPEPLGRLYWRVVQ